MHSSLKTVVLPRQSNTLEIIDDIALNYVQEQTCIETTPCSPCILYTVDYKPSALIYKSVSLHVEASAIDPVYSPPLSRNLRILVDPGERLVHQTVCKGTR
jgi:hypothetical protein